MIVRIAPKLLLEPEGTMKERIVLLGCPWLEPDSPQTLQGTQPGTRDIGGVIPQNSTVPGGVIGQHRDHRQNQAEKPPAFPPTHDRRFIGRSFLRLGPCHFDKV